MLRARPHERSRMTRGRCGSLLLQRVTLPFTTPRRFNPAHGGPAHDRDHTPPIRRRRPRRDNDPRPDARRPRADRGQDRHGGARRVGDLKGKAIGVTRVGATTWVFARMLAKKEGWDPDKDLQLVGLGGLDAQLAAMARKEISAYVWGDGGAVTELQGKSKVLLRLDSVTPKWISQIQYASEDAIFRQTDAIRKSQRALFRALKLMRENPRDAA